MMGRFVISAIVVWCVWGCTTYRSFEREKTTVVRDTVLRTDTLVCRDTLRIAQTNTVYADRIVYDTVLLEKVKYGLWTTDTLRLRTAYAEAWAGVHRNVPYLGLKQDDVEFTFNSYRETVRILEQRLTERDRQVEKRTMFYENVWFWVSISLGLIIVILWKRR